MNDALILFFLFITKHFIVDFPLQDAYMYQNKGIYLHTGGVLHAFLHGISTLVILALYYRGNPLVSFGVSLFDMIIHYHIDYFKIKINKIKNWQCDTSDQFWWMVGLDQYLHYLTYLFIIYVILTYK